MPRNRRSRDRDEKRNEIVVAARSLFIADGFAEVSMARIAREAKVTPTTIYWYFADKDELLVAVLDDLLATSLSELEPLESLGIEELFLLAATRLTELGSLVDTVHTRRLSSPAIDEWHDNFHGLAETITRAVLADRMDVGRVDAVCRMTPFVIEGIVTHRPPEAAVRAMAAAVAAMVDGDRRFFTARHRDTIDTPRLVAAIVDRVTFNAHILETGTTSYRLTTSKRQRTKS